MLAIPGWAGAVISDTVVRVMTRGSAWQDVQAE